MKAACRFFNKNDFKVMKKREKQYEKTDSMDDYLLDPVGGWGGGSENLFGACGQQR